MRLFKENIAFVNFLGKHFADKPVVGVEIGVNRGVNSESIMKTLNIIRLFAVDPYLEFELYGNAHVREDEAFRRLSRFNGKVEFVYKKSIDAVDIIPNELDFVYIDGEHTYPTVSSEIRLYYPKLKTGGVLGFDDFSPRCVGVANAVIEFVFKENLKLMSGKSTDCWVVKGK